MGREAGAFAEAPTTCPALPAAPTKSTLGPSNLVLLLFFSLDLPSGALHERVPSCRGAFSRSTFYAQLAHTYSSSPSISALSTFPFTTAHLLQPAFPPSLPSLTHRPSHHPSLASTTTRPSLGWPCTMTGCDATRCCKRTAWNDDGPSACRCRAWLSGIRTGTCKVRCMFVVLSASVSRQKYNNYANKELAHSFISSLPTSSLPAGPSTYGNSCGRSGNGSTPASSQPCGASKPSFAYSNTSRENERKKSEVLTRPRW